MAAHRVSASSAALAALILFLAVAVTQAADATDKKADGSGNGAAMPPTPEDLVAKACRNLSTDDLMGNKTRFKEAACNYVLRSDGRSAAAKDYGDLVLVALDTLRLRSSQAAASIGRVPRSHKTQSWSERVLRYCDADYGYMAETFPVCRNLFLEKTGKGEGRWNEPSEENRLRIQDALQCMDKLGEAAKDCYKCLAQEDYKEQMEESEYVVKHAGLTWGLMQIALNYRDGHSSEW